MRTKAAPGPKVVVARSAEGNSELSGRLRELGTLPVAVDTVEFLEPSDWSEVDGALANIGRFDWVGLTSPRGASIFARRMRSAGRLSGEASPRIAAVGEKTAETAREEGFEVGFVPSEYTTVALGEQLPKEAGMRVLLLRAERADDEVVEVLKGRGFSVTAVPIYRTGFIQGRYHGPGVEDAKAVLLGSPSEVEGLVRRLEPKVFETLRSGAVAICIGPVTAKAAREAGFGQVLTPRIHTFDALLMEVGRAVAR